MQTQLIDIDYDLEFIEDGHTIDVISIGIARTSPDAYDTEYYAVNKSCDFSKANDWVLENVLQPMGLDRRGFDVPEGQQSELFKQTLSYAKTKTTIARDVILFVLGDYEKQNYFDWPLKELIKVEVDIKTRLWGYYSAYDHVALCQLFGTMMSLPKCLPMYTNDIKQLCVSLGNPQLPAQDKGLHNALYDARWNKKARLFLEEYKQRRPA
jgi:hypothetical protein